MITTCPKYLPQKYWMLRSGDIKVRLIPIYFKVSVVLLYERIVPRILVLIQEPLEAFFWFSIMTPSCSRFLKKPR